MNLTAFCEIIRATLHKSTIKVIPVIDVRHLRLFKPEQEA